ncbi:hypothetical protein [Mesorhizobium sp.]|uniref:hypothetical protein n=1 Tax=Mesorhizobium sp. TaxID=1871066 RepID=UPI0025BD683D|nr:hypothetical protein [Mesorhizobium sp.]
MSDVLFMCRPELAQNLFGFVGRMAIARQLIDKSALWRAICFAFADVAFCHL